MLSTMADKAQAFLCILPIDTVISFRPLRLFQPPLFFIIANGDDLTSCHLCQLPDFNFHPTSLGTL